MRDPAQKYRRAVILLGRLGLNGWAAWVCRWALRRCPPYRAEFLVLLAHFRAGLGDGDHAVEALELSARESPLEADALLGLAGVYCEKEHRFEEASSYYVRALSTPGETSKEFRADLRNRLQRCRAAR
jgi:tetratricopeptide (TPR) repeat protein